MTEAVHTVRLKANLNRVRALYQGHVIADTNHALTVLETGLAPVQYFPREDVEMGFLGKTEHHTHCPYKGEASYFTLTMDVHVEENVVWTYENPIHDVLAIKDYVAFYPNRVEVYELSPSDEAQEPRAAHPHAAGP